jgi:hypothetical protein
LIPGKRYFKYINFWLNLFFKLLVKLRIISWIVQKKWLYDIYKGQTDWYIEKKWLINSFKYISWFFIYEWEHIRFKDITINNQYIKRANKFINWLPDDTYKIFIHIRRWDYLEWSVMWQKNLTLPINFYKKQIKYFLNKYKNISFVFLSDDIKWCKKEFDYLQNSLFSENDLWTDFALMTLCDWAIISASTLSYLWAYFMDNKIEIFAPKYWLGYSKKTRYPKGINTKKFTYIDIV